MKLLLIGSDTVHRRYMINRLLDLGLDLDCVIFPAPSLPPKFDTSSPWANDEDTTLVERFCDEARNDLLRVKVLRPTRLSCEELEVASAVENADCVIVSGAGWIRGEFLAAITHKSFNVHMGIAKAYRGLDSNLWAWYHKDYENIGVTLHKLNEKLDAGDIIYASNIKVNNSFKVWELRYYESLLAVELVNRAIVDIRRNVLIVEPQTMLGRYYSHMPRVIKNNLPIKPTSNMI